MKCRFFAAMILSFVAGAQPVSGLTKSDSVSARSTPIAEAVAKLSHAARVVVLVEPGIAGVVSLSTTPSDPMEALRQIARSRNLSLTLIEKPSAEGFSVPVYALHIPGHPLREKSISVHYRRKYQLVTVTAAQALEYLRIHHRRGVSYGFNIERTLQTIEFSFPTREVLFEVEKLLKQVDPRSYELPQCR